MGDQSTRLSETEKSRGIPSKTVITGFLLELISLFLVWIFIPIIIAAKQSCLADDMACTQWRSMLVLLSGLLIFFSLAAFFQFRAIPNRSVPPEKAIGMLTALAGLIAGIIIMLAALIGNSST